MPDNLVYIENNGNYFLAGDGNRYYIIDRIGYNLNTLESNGNYSLAEGGIYNQYYIFDSNGNSIGLTDSSGNPVSSNNGYSVVQAEEGPDGGFHVLWSGPQGIIPSVEPIMAWKVDASGQYQNHIIENIDYHETTFQVDLNGGGISTLSHDSNTGLTDISGNQNHIINNSIVLKNIHGTPVGPDSFGVNPVKWNAVQVEQNAAGGFEVMWSDVGSDTPLDPLAWKADATGTYIEHKSLTTGLREAFELTYKVDLDGDGRVTLETNGVYELAISGNQYQIIEIGGGSLNYLESNDDYKLAKGGDQFYIVDSSGNSIRYGESDYIKSLRAGGWTDLQVEETDANHNGFEVLFYNESWAANDGYWSLRFNAAGEHQGFRNASVDRHESWFQVDLNGDGSIASESHNRYGGLTDISGNKHHELDGYGASGTATSFGNSNRSDGWSATQVEAGSESGTFEVFWSNTDGRSEVTNINNTGKYQSTITREMLAHETAFQADLDGDGVVGLNLVSIETNGSYELATSHNQYYIIDNNNIVVTSFGNSNMSDAWTAGQVELSVGGGFEVFWSNTDGRSEVTNINDTGKYQSTITRTIDQHETAFQVDLDGDGVVGLNLVSIETNGSYKLSTSHNQYYIIDNNNIVVTSFGSSNMSDAWTAAQVELSVGGGFEVFWSHAYGRTTAHKISDTGVYQSTITRTLDQHETAFQVDLDGDGVVGLNLLSIETNGSYELATSNSKYQIIDNNSVVTSFGNSNRSDGWSATQVEAGSESGTFEVFWSNTDGRSEVTNINNTGKYQSTITREMLAHETAFQADLDGDGVVGLNLVSIETNGSYELATSHNQYYIIDNNNIVVTSFGNSNMSDAWTAGQVELSESGTFEVFWSNTDGRSEVTNINDTGKYQSTITRTIDQHETAFQVDLDGDGVVGLNLVSIETNGSYKLSTSHNQYYIIDNNNIVVTSFGSSNMSDAWTAAQVELSVGGGFEVFWSHAYGRTTAHKISDTGVYQSTITRTLDQHETAFQVDLDGDGVVGLNLVNIETNGSYELATSNSKYQIIDSHDSIVTSFGNSNRSDGWSATQVEAGSESGTFEVFWSNTDGRSEVTNINDTGKYQSTITRTIDQHETAFQVDLDGDGVVGLNLVSIETNGSYKLSTSHNQYYIIDNNNIVVTSFGSSNMSDAWTAAQVELSVGGGFEVFWSHAYGRTTAHKISDTGVYQSTITRTLDQHETAFQVDLDGDGVVGLNLVNIETNGSYELATSNSKYQIIDSHDSIVTSFGNSNRSDGWSATQVEAGSESGTFEVFWSNTDGRSEVTNINNTGKFQSTITREMLAHETVFQADLDGDGLTTIETNGEFKFIGGVGNDTINGGAGNDTLDGGKGSDTITTGNGSDQIILRIGDGGNTLLDADIITDFTDGSDDFGLTNGLSFGDLTRSQGTDDYANDSIISHGLEYLAILRNIDVSHLTETDFVNVDIA